jgi:hypothetical protein
MCIYGERLAHSPAYNQWRRIVSQKVVDALQPVASPARFEFDQKKWAIERNSTTR